MSAVFLAAGIAIGVPVGMAVRAAEALATSAIPELAPKKALRIAEAALDEGRRDEALEYFDLAIKGTSPDDRSHQRASALCGAGLLRMSRGANGSEREQGVALLEELKRVYPAHDCCLGAEAALDQEWVLREVRAENARLAEELRSEKEGRRKDAEDAKVRIEAAQKAADERADEAVQERQRAIRLDDERAYGVEEIAALRAQLEEKTKEIAQKDEALRRMKRALVEPRKPIRPGESK